MAWETCRSLALIVLHRGLCKQPRNVLGSKTCATRSQPSLLEIHVSNSMGIVGETSNHITFPNTHLVLKCIQRRCLEQCVPKPALFLAKKTACGCVFFVGSPPLWWVSSWFSFKTTKAGVPSLQKKRATHVVCWQKWDVHRLAFPTTMEVDREARDPKGK